MKEKKILYITRPLSPPWDEASKNFAYNLAQQIALKNSNFEINILTKKKLTNLSSNIRQYSIYTSSQNDFNWRQKKYLFQFLLKTILQNKFNLWHSFFTPTKMNTFLLKTIFNLSFKKNKPRTIQTIATLREDLYSEKEFKKILFADWLITYSHYALKRLKKMGFKNVTQIYPGIDLKKFKLTSKNSFLLKKYNFSQNDFIINFTGEYVRLNAIDDVISSFLEISQKIPQAKLSLAVRVKNSQDAQKKKEVIQFLQKNNLLKRVAFHDDGNYTMSDIYNLADVSLFPVQNMQGKFDIPLAVIEAMACEKPVVISDIPILQEFSNQKNSVQIKAGNFKQLSNAVIDLYKNPEKRLKIGKRARQYVKNNFNLENAEQKYSQLYHSLLK